MTDELHQSELRPILEGVGESAPPARRRPASRAAASARAAIASMLRADVRLSKRGSMLMGASLAALGVCVGGAFAWSAFRPISAPDFASDPLGDVLGFALLDADFSRLPVEERLRLALDLVKRFRTMSAGDSALLAAFAAGISGKAREQLEANVRTLGMDLMASYGEKYAKTPDAEKEKYLEGVAVEWSKLSEQLTGEERNITDAERLKEMKDQAAEDAERGRRTDRGLRAENVSGLFKMVQSDINRFGGPNQRAGTQRFLRDMTRTLRGRDPATNKPAKN